MGHVKISMHDVQWTQFWKESLHLSPNAGITHKRGIVLFRLRRKHCSPQTRRPVSGDLKAVTPRTWLGEIATIRTASLGLEIEWRRENDKSFRPGKAVEGDFAALSHRAATAICANQISASVNLYRSRSADIEAYELACLPHIDNFVIEQHLDIRQPLHPFEEQT